MESEQEPAWKLEHADDLYFKEQTVTDNKANSYMCLAVNVIQLKVSLACVRLRFKGGLAALPSRCQASPWHTLQPLAGFFS